MYLRLDRKIGSTEHHFGKKADRLNLFSLSSVAAWFCLGGVCQIRSSLKVRVPWIPGSDLRSGFECAVMKTVNLNT